MKRLFSSNTISQKLRENRFTVDGEDVEMADASSTFGRTKKVLTQALNKTKGSGEDEEVGILHLIKYLMVDMEKRMHLRQMIPYLFFLIILTALALSDLSFGGYSDQLQQTEQVKQILLADELQKIEGKSGLWDWVTSATKSIYAAGIPRYCNTTSLDPVCSTFAVGSETIPVAIILIRQWRVRIRKCGNVNGLTSKAVSPCDLTVLPCNCTHQYNADEAETGDFYGENGVVYVADAAKGVPVHPMGLTTQHLTYPSRDQYSIKLSLTESVEEAVENLTLHYAEPGWVDEQTRVVSVETLFYNPDSEQFVRSSFFIEFFQTGLGVANWYIEPPYVVKTFTSDKAHSALSIIIMAYIIPFLYWLYQSLHFRFVVKKDLRLVGEMYQVSHVAVLSALTYYQGKMWDLSSVMSNGRFYEELLTRDDLSTWGETVEEAENSFMFHYSSRYAVYSRRYRELLALLLILSWLRMFKFLQHFQHLNILSETARIAAFDVFKLAFIFLYCVFAFSIAGSLVFQSEIQEFETPSHASSALLRMFFMEHEPDYQKMRDMQPLWAPIYVISFFLLCYFMLLNMVLAVIVSSFTQVQTTQETASRQLALREEAILDEEIAILRNRSNSVAIAIASRPSRISRTYKKTIRAAEKVYEIVAGWMTADNTQREKAIQLAKDHCARDLRIPRVVLKEHPEYLNRVSITKEEMKLVFAKLLSESDLENIFLGVQKRVFTQENTHVLIVQAMSELATGIQSKLEALETAQQDAFDSFEKVSAATKAAASKGGGGGGGGGNAATILQLRQELKEARTEVAKLTRQQAKSSQAAAHASMHQCLQDLNAEREFLVTQLAQTDMKRRGRIE